MKITLIKLSFILCLAIISCGGSEAKYPSELKFEPQSSVNSPSMKFLPISVIRFQASQQTGNASDLLLGEIISQLMNNGKYKIIERQQQEKILQELEWSLSDLTQDNIIKLGKLLNAGYIMVGEISDFSSKVDVLNYQQQKKGVASGIPGIPVQGGEIKPFSDDSSRTYQVLHFSASVSFSGRIVDVSTGQIIWSKSVSRSFGLKENQYGFTSDKTLLDYLFKLAIKEFLYDLTG